MKTTAVLLTLVATTLVAAGKFHDLPHSEYNRVVNGGYIVEYQEGFHHQDTHNTLRTRKVDYMVRKEYGIFNGAAIYVNSEHDGKALADMPGIKNVWPITLVSIPKTIKQKVEPSSLKMPLVHSMTGVDTVHKIYKLTGKGIKVGVIDSGVDYKHPAFALEGALEGCMGPNCRFQYGWDFVGDAYDGTSSPEPDSDPMDCEGHGTHVTGIIGANALDITKGSEPPYPFIGVAPEATFGAYRVFGCKGSSAVDVIMAAMEKAFNDGMDIINMSLGGGSAYKSTPQTVLGDKLVERGVVLVVAAGNDGAEGVWMVSDASLGDLSSSVASVDSSHVVYRTFTYGGATHPYAPSLAWNKPIELPASATLMPVLGKNGSLSDGCDLGTYNGVNIADKIVLVLGDVTRCKSGERGAIAQAAGAAGMLIMTTPLGIASLGGTPDFPMASIENRAGQALLKAYKANPDNTFTWSKKPSVVSIEGGGAPSSFSSFGLDGELRSKPDISAPGGNIMSTFPLSMGGYSVQSGTSMASPYVAGAHALYMQTKKIKLRGDEIRKTFKNTATLSKNYGSSSLTSVAKQGGGLINVLRAITTTSSITPDHIDLLDTNRFQTTVMITLRNDGPNAETYTLSHIPADTLNSYPDNNTFPLPTPQIEDNYATVSFSQNEITIPAGNAAAITISFTEPTTGDAAHFPIYSGFIIATPKSKESVPVHVPYSGLKGDFSRVPIMDTDKGFPALVSLNVSNGAIEKPEGSVATFDANNTVPIVVTRFGSHTPSFSVRVLDDSNKFLGYMVSLQGTKLIRDSGRNPNFDQEGLVAFSQWSWSGMIVPTANATEATRLPPGTYSIVVACQRKFTQGDYPADFEVYDIGKIKN
ncbi:hypothetical protein BG011_003742 [Mortierella polycephala]|uniref:Subtilisin-like protein n=1 Tax=Mortierella polycephala TaxID=41804 RepID=A0A9P6U3B2_9FUNG|nr:hypothetical protein BG011_003742 [Mortierella polycephala]